MEYYDGMGNNRTAYVLGLERRIKELEALMESQSITVKSGESLNPVSVKPHKKRVS